MDNGGLLALLAGMILVVLGIFQFAQGVVTRADTKRQELFNENEQIRRKLLDTETELELLQERCRDKTDYIKKLTAYAKKLEKTNLLLSEQVKDYQGTRD